MPLRHALFALGRQTATATAPFPRVSPAVATAGRARWSVTVLVAEIRAAGATLVLEASATGDTTDAAAWTPVGATHALSARTVLPITAVLHPFDAFLRVRLVAATGTTPDLTLSVEAAAAFFDPTHSEADRERLTQAVREFPDLGRLATRAEELVLGGVTVRTTAAGLAPYDPFLFGGGVAGGYAGALSALRPLGSAAAAGSAWLPDVLASPFAALAAEARAGQPGTPSLDLDLSIPGVLDALVAEIVAQTEHGYRREMLARSTDPASIVTLRNLPELAPGGLALLAPYRRVLATAWRGR